MSEAYEASHIKRKRRSREEINELWTAIRLLLQEDNPMTVRQVFYQMAARRAVDKTENGYNLVQRNLAEMRRSGFLKLHGLPTILDGVTSRTRFQASLPCLKIQ